MAREWKAEDILGMARAYQRTCVLAAATELDIFTVLGSDRLTSEDIARRIAADLRATTVLLDALAAIELLEKRDGAYSVPDSVGPLLAAGSSSAGSRGGTTADRGASSPGEQTVLAMTRHQASCMRRWTQLAGVVRSGRPAERTPSIRGADADREAFIEAMNDINRAAAEPLVRELAITDFSHLLDVGGASGTWTMAWLDANPRARATLFDLPHVVPLAEARLRRRGYADRVRLVAGDFSVDPLPGGADLLWLSAIVHQNSRGENRELFARAYAALVVGGRILIRDIVMDESRTAPVSGALFAVNMLTGTTGGGTFTFDELEQDLATTGFEEVELLRRDEGMHSVVQARKPA